MGNMIDRVKNMGVDGFNTLLDLFSVSVDIYTNSSTSVTVDCLSNKPLAIYDDTATAVNRIDTTFQWLDSDCDYTTIYKIEWGGREYFPSNTTASLNKDENLGINTIIASYSW